MKILPTDLLARFDHHKKMSDNSKQWWLGLPEELQADIEFEE
ncbi:hypothetical protein [Nitrosopumilus sp.]|nr:hypothetical protein [Nitrosopumilus sp.]